MSSSARVCLENFINAVNSGNAEGAFDVLREADVRVPHGVQAETHMKGDDVKQWLESEHFLQLPMSFIS